MNKIISWLTNQGLEPFWQAVSQRQSLQDQIWSCGNKGADEQMWSGTGRQVSLHNDRLQLFCPYLLADITNDVTFKVVAAEL